MLFARSLRGASPSSAGRKRARACTSVALALFTIPAGLDPSLALAAPAEEATAQDEDAKDEDTKDDAKDDAAEAAGAAEDGAEDSTDPRYDSAGMGGNVVNSDDPESQRASAELEGASLDDAPEGVPDRMEPLQAAAWWTMFGTFALATTGGLFVGLSQVQQDNADRLTTLLDDEGNAVPFETVQVDYDDAIAKGKTYNTVATGFLIASGATLIASITMFAVHGARKRRARRELQTRLQLHPGGLQLRF